VRSGKWKAAAGERRPENRWKTSAALRAEIEDGVITEWRVYADNEPLLA
jgi:hypothetical protein